ncbi:glucosidase II beta subunit-like protein-domain-containing protein [Lasiosphaeris hirsuta]|uniref:Endoplasmic reticulum lectin n=1 Tax=Lasiosphaeris hirsuta TaxID=260670 RepID=A0AA39ZXN3_9PEZI|nr:glucosidase II beta subunit-like protein-domain-containing protein [Lasiosphaeris hirsuta]
MRRLNLVLLASLQLCGARQPGFSIHEDLLAHPQFEVVFSDTYILEHDALALLESKRRPDATYAADLSQTDLASNVRESTTADAANNILDDGANDGGPQVSETYEIISSPPSRFLCSVPVIAPPPALNQTATELAKAEEARELSRASTKGWELMSGLDGHCLYFVSGWWSYTFCYGDGIRQFHALPAGPNGGPPVIDPHSQEYVLGTTNPTAKARHHGHQPTAEAGDRGEAGEETKGVAPPNTELQVKGDQRYLVQRLGGGTLCDLTGKPRTVEVQFHCHPGASSDRIGWIKEVTTCTYLMMVQTPRLCADVAFLPPKETRAHPISCRTIVGSDDELEAWHHRKTIEAREAMGVAGAGANAQAKGATKDNPFAGITIGGIVVGGRRVLGTGRDGQPVVELETPRGFTGAKAAGNALAEKLTAGQKKGAEVDILTTEELEALGIDQETYDAVRKELRRIGGDNGWEIAVEVVPEQGGQSVASEGEEGEGKKQTRQTNGQNRKGGGGGGGGSGSGKKAGSAKNGAGGRDEGEEEGSQEVFFKEEL